MVKDDAEFDKKLAAYSEELKHIAVPAELEDRILSSVTLQPNASSAVKQAIWAADKSWLWAGCAASLAAISLSLFFSGGVEEPVMALPPSLPIANTVTSYPVRVHSLSQGAQWRYVQSQTVKDKRGVTRLLVVSPSRRNQ